MKQLLKIMAILLILVTLTGQLGAASLAADDKISTTPTGYTRPEDVEYMTYSGSIAVTSGTSYTLMNVVMNWGARAEDCVFLSTYAQNYYTDSYSWEALNDHQGGTGSSDAHESQLYDVLQDMMQSMHTTIQDYQLTRAYYSFTDCVRNDFSQISSFYSGNMTDGKWISQAYNREHIWPKSKCINTNKADDSADIMLLRPTLYSENSNRGNTAYGESGGYYDPGPSVRGDCARMVLYGYVRWGNTGKMWGSGGVMESLDILLKWMEEDPVDTWEMGRNDAVQSITGVRNVFVDFPEFAWLLFGMEVPNDIVTPSGSTAQQHCEHKKTELRNAVDATCTTDGYTGDSFCIYCGEQLSQGERINKLGEHSLGDWITVPGGGRECRWCSICGYEEYRDLPACTHTNTEDQPGKAPTCTEDGYTGNTLCYDCGRFTVIGEAIPATGHLNTEVLDQRSATCTENGYTGDTYCTDCGSIVVHGETLSATGHQHTELRDQKNATCSVSGYSGDTYCIDCGILLEQGTLIHGTGEHDFSEWVGNEDGASRTCKVCGFKQQDDSAQPEPHRPFVVLGIAAVVLVNIGICAVLIIRKKK